jgi:hypothetical protein
VICIPFCDEFVAGFANVLTVQDGAGEDARDVEPVAESGTRSILDIERAVEGNC